MLPCLEVDLASLASVRQFGKRLCIQHPSLDYLVLNAGVFALPFTTTQDNVETMMQVRVYLSMYLVSRYTTLLLILRVFLFI